MQPSYDKNVEDLLDDDVFYHLLKNRKYIELFEELSGIQDIIAVFTHRLIKNQKQYSIYKQLIIYILKYLWDNWLLADRTSRMCKKFCLRVLFLFFFAPEHSNDWESILKTAAGFIEDAWGVKYRKYPCIFTKDKAGIREGISAFNRRRKKTAVLQPPEYAQKLSAALAPKVFDEDLKKVNSLYADFFNQRHLLGDNDSLTNCKAVFAYLAEGEIKTGHSGILTTLPVVYLAYEIEKALHKVRHAETTANFNSGAAEVSESELPYTNLLIRYAAGRQHPLPFWARWFCDAGASVAALSRKTQNLVVGFSLPARAYAALFFLLGYETWMARNETDHDPAEGREYFDALASGAKGCPLLILEGERWKRCFYEQVEIKDTTRLLRVKVQGTDNTQYLNSVSEKQIFKIRSAVNPSRHVGDRQRGFAMPGNRFLMACYGLTEQNLLKYLIQNQHSYWLFASRISIRTEIEHTALFAAKKKGSFQDILRFRDFMSEFAIPKSKIGNSFESLEKHSASAHVTVFDGARYFLKFQGNLKSPVEIIFLDRTENHFANAVDELMTRYYDRKSDIPLFSQPPLPIEVIAFEE